MVILSVGPLAEDNITFYPLDIKIQVYPEEIRYGDPCFFTFSITNQGQEALYLPYGSIEQGALGNLFLKDGFCLFHGEKEVLRYSSGGLSRREVIFHSDGPPPHYASRPVNPGETMEFHVRMIWFPLPELAHDTQSKELLQLINSSEMDYKIQFSLHFDATYQLSSYGSALTDGLRYRELRVKGYRIDPDLGMVKSSIRILPRSGEEIELLREWYLELPTLAHSENWTMENVFAHQFYVRDSPLLVEFPTRGESHAQRTKLQGPLMLFLYEMGKRSPATLERIA